MRYSRSRKAQRRRRAVFLTLVVVITAILLCTCSFPENKATREVNTDTYVEYIVKDGDTIWDIAKLYVDKHTDVRVVVREIREVNQLSGTMIYNGDVLLIPTKYCGE